MGAGRRLQREEERFHARRRRSDQDAAMEAAAQKLIECWPWLAEQYRLGNVPELPMGPLEAAIACYMAHTGIDP